MKKSMLKVVAVCFMAVFLAGISGCATQNYTFGKIPDDVRSQFVVGQTTKVDVLKKCGDPDQKISLGQGKEQFSYIQEDVAATPRGMKAEIKTTNTEYWIIFDSHDVMTESGSGPTNKQRKNGFPQAH